MTCPATQYAVSLTDSGPGALRRSSLSPSLPNPPACLKLNFEFAVHENGHVQKYDLGVVVGPLSLTVHWPAAKFLVEMVNSIGDLLDVPFRNDERVMSSFVEDDLGDNGKDKERVNEVGTSLQATGDLHQNMEENSYASMIATIPSISFEFQGLEVVIPTSLHSTDFRGEKGFLVLELRNALLSYSKTDESVIKVPCFRASLLTLLQVKAILSRIGLNEFRRNFSQASSHPVPVIQRLAAGQSKRSLRVSRSLRGGADGEVLFDRNLASAKRCQRPLLKPFDLVTTVCVSLVGQSSSTTGTLSF